MVNCADASCEMLRRAATARADRSTSLGISLSCSGSTEGMTCTVPQGPFILSGSTVVENVTITTTAPEATHRSTIAVLRHGLPAVGMCLLGCVLFSVRRKTSMPLALILVVAGCFVWNSCGGGSGSGGVGGGGGTPPGSYTFTLTATSGSDQKSSTVTVVVQ
jgi:hypothetical protein